MNLLYFIVLKQHSRHWSWTQTIEKIEDCCRESEWACVENSLVSGSHYSRGFLIFEVCKTKAALSAPMIREAGVSS